MGHLSKKVLQLALLSATGFAHKSSLHQASDDEINTITNIGQLVQETIFSYSPRYNSILATLAIQLAPCFVIFSIPGLRKSGSTNQDSALLPILVSFAFGTLLGDVFLHLIPEIFESAAESHTSSARMGSAIFAGFILFLTVDKILRIISTGSGNESSISSHSHSHVQQPQESSKSTAVDFARDTADLSKRKSKKQDEKSVETPVPASNSRASAYLSIITGCIHNVTDGIALASSFYNSKHIGATTTIAVIFHEIPHELGDFVILLSSGFTFAQAVKSQLLTSLGALAGTAVGCLLNELGTSTSWTSQTGLLLPISCGGFLYIAAVGVAPQVLQSTSKNKTHEIRTWTLQLISITSGFAMMAALSLIE